MSMYKISLDGLELPLGVPELTTNINNRNTEVSLINGEVMSIPKSPGLTTWKFNALIPSQNVDQWMTKLQNLKLSKKPFKFQVLRNDVNNATNIMVTLEDYNRSESASIGPMSKIAVTLKEYRAYETSYVEIEVPEYVDPGDGEIETTVVPYSKEIKRIEKLNPPAEYKVISYSKPGPFTVLTGQYIYVLESWKDIAKKLLGNEKYGPAIMALNKSQANDKKAWSHFWSKRYPPSLYPRPHAIIKINVSDIVNTYHKLESES